MSRMRQSNASIKEREPLGVCLFTRTEHQRMFYIERTTYDDGSNPIRVFWGDDPSGLLEEVDVLEEIDFADGPASASTIVLKIAGGILLRPNLESRGLDGRWIPIYGNAGAYVALSCHAPSEFVYEYSSDGVRVTPYRV